MPKLLGNLSSDRFYCFLPIESLKKSYFLFWECGTFKDYLSSWKDCHQRPFHSIFLTKWLEIMSTYWRKNQFCSNLVGRYYPSFIRRWRKYWNSLKIWNSIFLTWWFDCLINQYIQSVVFMSHKNLKYR